MDDMNGNGNGQDGQYRSEMTEETGGKAIIWTYDSYARGRDDA